jgi:hypothetical protein
MIAMSNVLQRNDTQVRTTQRWAARAPWDAARRGARLQLIRPHPAGLADSQREMLGIPRPSEAKPQARWSQQNHPDEKKEVAAAIRDYIARERMSREQFAFRTRLGKSTVDKLLIGIFSDKTLSVVESHTRLSLRVLAHRPDACERGNRVQSAVPDGPAIAVLPFAYMSSGLDQEHVADGLVADIVTALSHLPRLRVVARASTLA